MGKRYVSSILLLLLLTACFPANQTPPVTQTKTEPTPPKQIEYTMSTVFNEDDFKWSTDNGDATIAGQAFLKTKGGDVKYGAGEDVLLIPKCKYTDEYVAALNVSSGADVKIHVDPLLFKYMRTTKADGNGSFEFPGLPEGEYHVVSEITWQIPGKYRTRTTGGLARAVAKAVKGKTIKVIVTG